MGDCDGYQFCAKPVLERVAAFPVTVAVFFHVEIMCMSVLSLNLSIFFFVSHI